MAYNVMLIEMIEIPGECWRTHKTSLTERVTLVRYVVKYNTEL